ncbi:alpha-amylase family glycosyl hydrolase [Cellulosilyticum ruminicola]|uniref:alpha-amylase family glycosyl hydrolase n=1 Tax=Cellulosilyticum ruminicola TaxID=425254 RepID=UPI0006D0650D|nr:alpha-amylase family glycosyl hydrolase [Cellulosilyticum ruminicola]
MYNYIKMYKNCRKTKVYFEYRLFEDDRLNVTEPKTEWERYCQEKLFRKSDIKYRGASGVEAAGISIFNSLDHKKVYMDMNYEECNGKYTVCMELEPGLYFYEFVLNPHKNEDEQVWIMDNKADTNLKIPNLSCPGFRYSGIMVYPDFNECNQVSEWLKNSFAQITNIDEEFYEINLATVGYVDAELLIKDDKRVAFELISDKNNVKYFYLKRYMKSKNEQVRIILKNNMGEETETVIKGNNLIESKEEWTRCPDSSDGFETPQWSKEAIWYNLMPDRFRYKGEDTRKTENWKKDWYTLRENEREYYPDIYYRECGGNLDGIIEKLDYLEGLGVNAICVTPVFWGSGYHKYHTVDLRHIDPNFGPDPEYDIKLLENANETLDPSTWVFTKADMKFIELVEKIHDRNMKIIVDGVFSHTGEYFWAFKDIKKNRQDSQYYDWFAINECSEDKFEYMGFFGMSELPKLKLYGDHQAPLFDKHLYDITRRWMEPLGDGNTYLGVDGWRLDVANELPVEFWRKWRKHVKSINKDAYILGEMMFTSYEPFLVDSYDAIINYRFGELLYDYFIKPNDTLSTGQFVQKLKENAIKYNSHSNYSMQNILDSHDTDRISSMIKNKKRGYCYDNKVQYSYHHYDGSAPSQEDFKILRLLIAFQIGYVGAPALYYGTECGMWGGNDPHCRKPMLWDDIGEYEPERLCYPADPNNSNIVNDVVFDHQLRDEVSYLYHLRKDNQILSTGKIGFLEYSNEENWLSLIRYTDDDYGYIFIFNKDHVNHRIELSLDNIKNIVGEIQEVESVKRHNTVNLIDRKLVLELDGISYEILKFKKAI